MILKKASLSEHITHLWNWGNRSEWAGKGASHARAHVRRIEGSWDLPTLLAFPWIAWAAEEVRAGAKACEPRCSLLSTRGCDDTDGILSEDSRAQMLSIDSSAQPWVNIALQDLHICIILWLL